MTGYELCYRSGCGHASSMHGSRGCELDPVGHCPAFVEIPKGYAKSNLSPADIRTHEEVLAVREATAKTRRKYRYSTTVQVGDVSDVGPEYEFSDRDTDVEEFMKQFNINPDEEFGAVFVKKSALSAGDVGPDDIYFILGIVPEFSKGIYRVNERRP
jgi:hypothetical protein